MELARSPTASIPKACLRCQAPFIGFRRTKYCGATCRRAAKNAYLRDYMKGYRAQHGYRARKNAWAAEGRQGAETVEVPRRAPLPPLTRKEYWLYLKLRRNAVSRADALAVVLDRAT